MDRAALILATWSRGLTSLTSVFFQVEGGWETWLVLEEQPQLPPGLPNRNLRETPEREASS